jgi:hypothetical protein
MRHATGIAQHRPHHTEVLTGTSYHFRRVAPARRVFRSLNNLNNMAYDARRTNCLPSIRDLHGESPRRPHRTQPMQNPPVPVPFTLPVAYPSHSYDQSQRDVFY